ncbi:hypothetical protein K449DRAFT_388650 [Hypoxylon sp. EC38]|nr:hypothetical protein K449DRAFT_388650 [Hypoxylon sp. EC38]
MPLFPISPNIQESDSASRKRTHEEFIDDHIKVAIDELSNLENLGDQKSIGTPVSTGKHQFQLSPGLVATMGPTPESSPLDLTEPGSSQSLGDSPSPNKTPSTSPQPNGTASLPTQANPKPTVQDTLPVKRKLTAVKKEEERAEKRRKKEEEVAEKQRKKEEEAAEKQRRKEAEAAEKAAKKAADEAAKAARAAEKEEREAARLAKKAETEAKKREKEQKEAKKAEEKRKKEEQQLAAQRKQAKQQNMLASFVKKAPGTPSKKSVEQVTDSSPKPDAKPATLEESKPQKSAYEQTFKPFFVKSGMILAQQPFEMDEETKQAKSEILDQYIRGERGPFNPKPFNPAETFNIAFPQHRGIMPPSVKKIMENIYGDPLQKKFDVQSSRTESQTEKLIVDAQSRLDTIPMKYLSFYEDVRPPYFGTITTPIQTQKLRKLSRRPVGKLVNTLNYDYDSEAEWVEDDGEDLDDDDEDEESNDGDGEMEDFLDDSDDIPVTSRPTFRGEVEPTSTGICFEDQTRLGPCESMYKYRLEFVLDTLDRHSGIDPFSSSYWPTPVRKKHVTASSNLSSTQSTSMPPPSTLSSEPTDAFSKLVLLGADAKELVPKAVFEEFTQAIVSEELRDFNKGTLVDLLARKFPSCTKNQVKFTLDRIAHRISVPGAKKSVKVWAIVEL